MNQAILFNDDLYFDKEQLAWGFTALLSGQQVSIFFHSPALSSLGEIDASTKFDLEEVVEIWLDKNEPEGNIINISLCD